ncbi:hypothetical protein FH972_024836 [Carpinus fangiana]|uniref:Uncharacterized protein n=1 Tax=Carpinus fangiana TaxID=176857 RepID=A0A5N6L1R2_9ROSI|nr:hypothetical protein FH972_024836 [Carpinus fangiana]
MLRPLEQVERDEKSATVVNLNGRDWTVRAQECDSVELEVGPWRSGDCRAGVEIAGIGDTADRERWSVESEVRVRRRRREYRAIAGGAGNTLGLQRERERTNGA